MMSLEDMSASVLAGTVYALGTAMAQEHMDERDIDLCYEAAARIEMLAARVAELEEMVGVLGRVADSAAESLASATGSAAIEPDEHRLIKIALTGGDGLETGLAAAAIRMSNRVAELEAKIEAMMPVVDAGSAGVSSKEVRDGSPT